MKWSLQRRIEAYLRRSGMPPTKFGLASARDPQLVFQVRRGRKLRPPTEAKVASYLDRAEAELNEIPRRLRRR
ncbi:MAG TPA: hypothetical protein VGB04_06980 [Allosphingosinicella sp.]